MASMLCDHLAKIIIYPTIISTHSVNWLSNNTVYLRSYDILTLIGRISFPIFAFFIVEGFLHTSNLKKYLKRLLYLALISEIPYDLAMSGKVVNFQRQNVIWTLLIGLLIISIINHCVINKSHVISSIFLTVLLLGIATFAKIDWGVFPGVSLIIIFYLLKDHPILKLVSGYTLLLPSLRFLSGSEFGFILLSMYNCQKGKSSKYFCYLFYPIHLLLLYLWQIILL